MPGHHADLGRQPGVQENTVVRRAEARLDGIMRERSRVSACHTAHFFGSALRLWPLAMMAFLASDSSLRSAKKETPRELSCGKEPLSTSKKIAGNFSDCWRRRTKKGRLDAFGAHRAIIERAASHKFDTQ